MILLLGGEKGGTGKSTLATNLAAWLAVNDRDVILVDTDVQRTAANWVDRRNLLNGVPAVQCAERRGNVFHALRDLAKRYEEVIVDAGGRDSEPEQRTTMPSSSGSHRRWWSASTRRHTTSARPAPSSSGKRSSGRWTDSTTALTLEHRIGNGGTKRDLPELKINGDEHTVLKWCGSVLSREAIVSCNAAAHVSTPKKGGRKPRQ